MIVNNDTICSISTALGKGAISIIRVSGNDTLKICNQIFQAHNKKEISLNHHNKVILGHILDNNKIIDEVLITIFKNPKSYTGEDLIEISCHGSIYIQDKIIQLLIKHGSRIAKKGEFTLRAFLNQKLDLSQAEGVAELISSETEKSHEFAMKQMKGGFSNEIKNLRNKFIKFASLIELELDFSEEDVEFANRKDLLKLITIIKTKIQKLLESFKFGNAIKNGIPISIVGNPNSGKSTLLNTILNEDRAIVSNIKGTTRDTIEEEITIQGYKFRFIDTAGLRETNNQIEKIGISKTYETIHKSAFVLYMIDKTEFKENEEQNDLKKIAAKLNNNKIIILANKSDLNNQKIHLKTLPNLPIVNISATKGQGVQQVLKLIIKQVEKWAVINQQIIIINHRHYESLLHTLNSINDVENALNSNVSGEFLSIDIKRCLEFLGEITGEITNENLLDSIFQDFCIGK
jgi:tRNA modification GTPase